MSRYFITGGGTGGHIYPAIAVADYLNDEGETIFYVGNPKNLEYDIVTKRGYKFLPVNVSGLPRKACLELFKWGFKLFFAVIQSVFYIIKYKPDVVFGTGGYVSAPALMAANILKTPYVMHDCDAKPGLVTRFLSKNAASVSLAFECAADYIRNENCYVNGNPIRMEFKTLTKEKARLNLGLENKLTICIMGGSQGARSINEAAVGILKTLSNDYNVQVIFQTGKRKFRTVEEHLSAKYSEYQSDKNLIVKPYFDDMISVLKASDIAVSRAGSLSISELCASSVATIFVPYPFAAADHQRKNARYMENQCAGIYLEDSEVSSDRLLELILDLIKNPDKLHQLQNNAFKLAKFDGVLSIVKQINENT